MRLEDQLSSLEPSRRLKELGVKQESFFWWTRMGEKFEVNSISKHYLENHSRLTGVEIIASAFTVAELGQMLPAGANCLKQEYYNPDNKWICMYRQDNEKSIYHRAYSEANARAKILIHLIEKGLVQI